MRRSKQLLTGAVGVLLVLLLIEGGRLVLADDNIVIELNGQPLQLVNEPLLVEDTVYVPVRALAEAVQAPVYWEPANRQILLLHEGQAESIRLAADDTAETQTAFADAGVVYMQLALLAEILGLECAWDADSGIAWLSSEAMASEEAVAVDFNAIDFNNEVNETGADVVWIKAGGAYELSGTFADGRLRIQTSEPVYLRLMGCDISSSEGAAIYAEGGGLISIEAVGDEPNTLKAGGSAAVVTDGALEIYGDGRLEILAEAGAGINADGFVRLAGADIDIIAAEDGIRAGQLLLADAGKLQVRAVNGAGLCAEQQIFINGGELAVAEAQCGIISEHIVMINGGSVSINAAGSGISAGAPTYNIQTVSPVSDDELIGWPDNECLAVVVKLDNEADVQIDNSIASIYSGELSQDQHIAINGGELVVNSGGAALLSQGSIEQQGGMAVLYAAKCRALAAGGVVLYDGGTLLAADGGQAFGTSDLHPASGGSWLEVNLAEQLPAFSEITIADPAGATVWSYQAAGEVVHLLFADSQLEPESAYQVLINGEAYMTSYAE